MSAFDWTLSAVLLLAGSYILFTLIAGYRCQNCKHWFGMRYETITEDCLHDGWIIYGYFRKAVGINCFCKHCEMERTYMHGNPPN